MLNIAGPCAIAGRISRFSTFALCPPCCYLRSSLRGKGKKRATFRRLLRRSRVSAREPDALRTVDCVVEAKAVDDLLIALNNAFKFSRIALTKRIDAPSMTRKVGLTAISL